MKVLFWLNIGLDRHSTSGHLLMAIIEKTRKMGNSVSVICKDTQGEDRSQLNKLGEMGVSVSSLPFIQPQKSNFAKRYFAELEYIRKSGELISENTDAVFIQSNIAAGFSVKKARKKCPKARITYNVQDVYPQDVMYAGKIGQNNPVYRGMLAVQKYAYIHSDTIITISEDMKDLLIEAGADESKVSVIYNWSYQDELFDKNTISPLISGLFDPKCFNVVYAGNIGLFQNVDVVIDVAKELQTHKDIWFHIFGEGMYKDKLERRTKKEGIKNVTFHPIQPHELAPSIYASASVNLIPLGKKQVRAALPSKTATCLACQQPIVFIIGADSKYGKVINAETNCPVLNCDDVKGTASAILDIKEQKIKIETGGFFLEKCSITRNSYEYAEIITGNEQEH